MAQQSSPSSRIIGILALLFVAVFAGFVIFQIGPWGEDATRTQSQSAEASISEDEAPSDAATEDEAEPTAAATQEDTSTADEAEHDIVPVTLTLEDGPVELELWRDVAPQHVERIATLAEQGFYDGIVFHRVIDGFMAQTGDPTGTGAGGSDLPDLPAEFSDEPFERGMLGMARTQDPNSANSQFFIMLAPAPHLNGQYTVFGRVKSGMEYVDAIKKGDAAANGLVENPDRIVSMTVDQEN